MIIGTDREPVSASTRGVDEDAKQLLGHLAIETLEAESGLLALAHVARTITGQKESNHSLNLVSQVVIIHYNATVWPYGTFAEPLRPAASVIKDTDDL